MNLKEQIQSNFIDADGLISPHPCLSKDTNASNKIKLTNCDEYCLVDANMFKELNQFLWYKDSHGYAVRGFRPNPKAKRTLQKMHRVVINAKYKEIVDHINRNPLDNRKCNLRIVTAQQNATNVNPAKDKVHSKFKGVTFVKTNKKWLARITNKGKCIFLGYFDKEIDAAKIYDANAKKFFGKYAKLNF